MDDDVEVPQYFICPISLHIMKDPVTVATGITYDRESIEQWLSSEKNTTTATTCPVTKLPISKDSDLTPNHTLRRLIQAWCTINASNGVDRIPTPKSPLNRIHVLQLIQDLSVPKLQLKSLKKLQELVSENDRNRKCMVEGGVPKAMVAFIIKCFKNNETSNGLEEALNVLHLILMHRVSMHEMIAENNIHDFIEPITWVLGLLCRRRDHDDQEILDHVMVMKTHAVLILKSILEGANTGLLYWLKKEFFEGILVILRDRISYQATKAALHVLLETAPFGRNRFKMIEAGVVSELIEIELEMPTEKRITELVLGVLDHLCACADGRAEFLNHASSIAMVSKRILRVSLAADEKATRILATICKFSATNEVLQEMLSVGGVSKLCMVLQAECSADVKDKARMVLRMHSKFWNNSPCIHIYLSTRFLGNSMIN